MLEGKDGQDDAHVGATSPSLGVLQKLVIKLTLLWYPWIKPSSYDSPATAPEKTRDGGIDESILILNYANKNSWYPEKMMWDRLSLQV